MIELDYWEAFKVEEQLFIVAFDFKHMKSVIGAVISFNTETMVGLMHVYGKDLTDFHLGGIQGLNIRTMEALSNWIKANNINKNNVIRNVDIFGEFDGGRDKKVS